MIDEIIFSELLRRIGVIEERIARTEVIEKREAIQGYGTTTDAAPTTIATIAIPASTTVFLSAFIVARRTGGTAGAAEDGAGYHQRATYKNVGGVATIIGVISSLNQENQAAWNGTLVVSGGNVIVQVTGAANNNVSWYCSVDKVSVSQ